MPPNLTTSPPKEYYNYDPAKQTATLDLLNEMLAEMSPGPERDKFEVVVKNQNDKYSAYKTANPHLFPDPNEESKMSKSAKRVRYLKTLDVTGPVWERGDVENYHAVIKAYETGKLDLEKQKAGEIALLWGGELKRGWGGLGRDFLEGPKLWIRENPRGKLWVEDGRAMKNAFLF